IWSALKSHRQQPHSFWNPENLCPRMMTYPCMLWRFIARILPWKITRRSRGHQTGQGRSSGQSARHHRKASSSLSATDSYQQQPSSPKRRTNSISTMQSGLSSHGYLRRAGTSSAVDTDAFSAGSGSESKSRSKIKSRKTRILDETPLRDGHPRGVGAGATTGSIPGSSPLSNSSSGNPVVAIEPSSTLTMPTETLSQPDDTPLSTAATTEDNNLSVAGVTGSALYETADDGDFISTDRRRRRKTKALRANAASNSSDSLPIVPQESASSSSAAPPVIATSSKTNVSPAIEVTKTPSSMERTESHPQDSAASKELTTVNERSRRQSVGQSRESSQRHPKTTTSISATASTSTSKASTTLTTTPELTSSTSQRATPALLQSPSDSSYIHPLHALNSTSPIVRLKPSHKRSQSAQLPTPSPWSIPQSPALIRNDTSFLSRKPSNSLSTARGTDAFMSTTSSVPPSIEQKDSPDSKDEGYDLFGKSSSIWYSPFQSGLDISIESDREQGKHGSRPLSRPRIQIDSFTNQPRPRVGPMLTPSSFFESSPQTPKIMPFSQHHSSIGSSAKEDWSIRTRSSSIASPMTPLLETEGLLEPMDYFGGSHSASSSRRGSTQNNLTESLLSGRARMFASPAEASFGQPRRQTLSQIGQHSLSSTSSERDNNSFSDTAGVASVALGVGSFLSPHYTSSIAPPSSSGTILSVPSTTSPVLRQQVPLELTPTASPTLPSSGDTTSTFVNPWDTNFPYRSKHSTSETFLPFGQSPLSGFNSIDTTSHMHADRDHDRQSSLLRLMNGDGSVNTNIGIGMMGITGLTSGGNHNDATLFGISTEREDEIEAIQRGFLYPSLVHHPHRSQSIPSLHSLESPSSPSSFNLFGSVAPLLEDSKYGGFQELSMPDLTRNPTQVLENNNVRTSFASSTSSLVSSSTSRNGGNDKKSSKDRHRQGRSRTGHLKSASLGSFFPPMPSSSDKSTSQESRNQPQQSNAGGALDPLSRSHSHGKNSNGDGRSYGPTRRGSSGGSKDATEGSNPTSGRRRAGTIQEGHYRGSGGGASQHNHNNHDSGKSKRTPKKEQLNVVIKE
ncbi:hypothetical protein BGZ98_000433, partial [Dissophora globulifera]